MIEVHPNVEENQGNIVYMQVLLKALLVDHISDYKFAITKTQVDIELPEDLPLKEAHAIGESLQIKIEELPEVERAFVHLDYECDHKPEHSVLIRLPNN